MLASFVTGIAFDGEDFMGKAASKLATVRPVLNNRILRGLPRGRLRSLPYVELASRGLGWLLERTGGRISSYDAIFSGHDAAVARLPWPSETTDVYAYEDAALRTFRRARDLGLGRIWDLPLPHHATIEELLQQEARRWPGALEGSLFREPDWKRSRKDAELALATKVSVASAFTKNSLEHLGLEKSIVTIPYGFPVQQFTPRAAGPVGPFTVLSVGSHDLRKGTPYLLEAWRRAEIPGAELHIVGPLRLSKTFVDRYAGTFRHRPHVPKSELQAHYSNADLLVFPTLGDGFGLVMQEAMCCAVPVVTTPCGGGPECITDGVDGWLVPARNVDAIVERLRAAASDRDHVSAVGRAARARAEKWTWLDAESALVRALGE
jgi:glycosyltransferase involved in cell wall biosynthesis